MKVRAGIVLTLISGCATARLVGEAPYTPPDWGQALTVVIEPFFENAQWITTQKTETATVMAPRVGFGPTVATRAFSQDVAVQSTISQKPIFAQVTALAVAHRQVRAEVQRLRPSWKVASTDEVRALAGQVILVRVIVGDAELIESNRGLKNLAFGFGLVIVPLQLFNIDPVEETQRVYGVLNRYDVEAQLISARLVRYPSQPDFAVNTHNWAGIEKRFGLDLTYTEGLLANETPRGWVLIDGFSRKLAAAIVALAEEGAAR